MSTDRKFPSADSKEVKVSTNHAEITAEYIGNLIKICKPKYDHEKCPEPIRSHFPELEKFYESLENNTGPLTSTDVGKLWNLVFRHITSGQRPLAVFLLLQLSFGIEFTWITSRYYGAIDPSAKWDKIKHLYPNPCSERMDEFYSQQNIDFFNRPAEITYAEVEALRKLAEQERIERTYDVHGIGMVVERLNEKLSTLKVSDFKTPQIPRKPMTDDKIQQEEYKRLIKQYIEEKTALIATYWNLAEIIFNFSGQIYYSPAKTQVILDHIEKIFGICIGPILIYEASPSRSGIIFLKPYFLSMCLYPLHARKIVELIDIGRLETDPQEDNARSILKNMQITPGSEEKLSPEIKASLQLADDLWGFVTFYFQKFTKIPELICEHPDGPKIQMAGKLKSLILQLYRKNLLSDRILYATLFPNDVKVFTDCIDYICSQSEKLAQLNREHQGLLDEIFQNPSRARELLPKVSTERSSTAKISGTLSSTTSSANPEVKEALSALAVPAPAVLREVSRYHRPLFLHLYAQTIVSPSPMIDRTSEPAYKGRKQCCL